MENNSNVLGALVLALTACSANAQIQFEDVTDAVGLDYVGESWGASWGNLNNDVLPDLFLTNHRNRASVLLNKDTEGFADVTDAVDVSNVWTWNLRADTHGASWADFDNDGDQDLYVASGGNDNNQVMLNENGVLRHQTQTHDPLLANWRGRLPLWMDFNDDGFLDMVMGGQSFVPALEQLVPGPGFRDVTLDTAILCDTSQTVVQADVDADGRLDLLCMDSSFPARVYSTDTLPFTDISDKIERTTLVQDVAIADFNNDLVVDFFTVRGAKRLSGASKTGARTVEAQLVGDFTAEKTLTFVSEGSITVFLATEFKLNTDMIHIGAIGVHPDADVINKREITFTLSPDDSYVVGLKSHNPAASQGIYIGYDTATHTWTIAHSPGGEWATVFVQVNSTANVSAVASQGRKVDERPMAPRLMSHQGSRFIDRTETAGLALPVSCVSTAAGDFDNDMDVDLYLVCRGAVENLPNILYENLGNGTFALVPGAGGAEGVTGFGVGKGESVVVADYDVDGFLDLFVTNGLQLIPYPPNDTGGPYNLLRNRGNDNHWVEIDLVGSTSNRDGVGAKVYANSGGVQQLREQNGGLHRWSQNHQRIHFGLGDNTSFDLRVDWPGPDPVTQIFTNLTADALYRVTQGGSIETIIQSPLLPQPAPPPAVETPACGAPSYDKAREQGVFIWQDCDSTQWHVRVTAGGQMPSYNGILTADQAFGSLNAHRTEATDVLQPAPFTTPTTGPVNFELHVAGPGQDGFDFDLANDANACFRMNSPAETKIWVGGNRMLKSGSVDLRDFGPCNDINTTLSTCGNPVYSPNSESGIFVWQECDTRQWRLRVTAGGNSRAIGYEGSLTTTHPYQALSGVALEDHDQLTGSKGSTLAGFSGMVGSGGLDGINFKTADEAEICLDISEPASAVVRVGVNRDPVRVPVNLRTLQSCTP